MMALKFLRKALYNQTEINQVYFQQESTSNRGQVGEGVSTQLNVHLREFFSSFLAFWRQRMVTIAVMAFIWKPQNPVLILPLGLHSDDSRRRRREKEESWTLPPPHHYLPKVTWYRKEENPSQKLPDQHFICENTCVWIGIVLAVWGGFNSWRLNYGVSYLWAGFV